jgi:hypothetical protein
VNSECRWLSNMRRQRTIMFSFRRWRNRDW